MYDGLKNLEVPRRSRGKHPGARKVLKFGGIGLLVLLIAVGGMGIWLYSYVNGKLDDARIDLAELDELIPDQAYNVLILGNDRRDVVPKNEREKRQFKGSGGHLTDTMLLLHVSPNADRALILSLPRDLRVDVPGCGTHKLNAAYSCGGRPSPDRAIETIKQLTGIDIHHYVEINFLGFREIVDAVGGVRICVRRGYDDPRSGLHLPKAGCYNMNGNVALSWVRARYIDPRADLGRVERQQQFIRALMSKVKTWQFLLNPVNVTNFVDALAKGIRISKNVDIGLARNIADKLSRKGQGSVDFRIVPNYHTYIGSTSYLIADQPDADRLFRAIANDTALPDVGKTAASLPTPGDVSVRILNGAGVAGLAGRERARLEQEGYDVVSIGDARSRYAKTIITYNDGDELKVELVQEQYPGAEVRKVARALAADVVVTLGRDVAEARASPSPSG